MVCEFFGHSNTRSEVLKKYIKRKIPNFCKTRRSFNEGRVHYVFSFFHEITVVLKDIRNGIALTKKRKNPQYVTKRPVS